MTGIVAYFTGPLLTGLFPVEEKAVKQMVLSSIVLLKNRFNVFHGPSAEFFCQNNLNGGLHFQSLEAEGETTDEAVSVERSSRVKPRFRVQLGSRGGPFQLVE